jgi:PAS domain S-box-containing protein
MEGKPVLAENGDDRSDEIESILSEWRTKALYVLLLAVAATGLPSYAYTIWNAMRHGQMPRPLLWIYLAAYLALVGLAFFHRLDFRLRAWGLFLLAYITAVASFARLGLVGSGRLYLVAVPVFAIVLAGTRAGYIAAALSLAIYAVFALVAHWGLLGNWLAVQANPLDLPFWVEAGAALAVFLILLLLLMERFYRLQLRALTARWQAKMQLQQTAEALREGDKFRLLIMNVPDVIWTTDVEGRTIFISPNVEKVYGFTPEEIYQAGSRLWLERIHPQDLERVKGAYQSLFARNEMFDVEYRIRRKGGPWIWLHDRAIATYEKDGVMYADRMLSDITKRIWAEEALRKERDFSTAVLDTAGALVVVLDQQGRIVRFNRACEKTTGYLFSEVEGEPFWSLFLIPQELESVKAVFDQLRVGQFPNEHENYWVAKDGSRHLIAWSNTAIVGADGAVEYVIAIGIDITERRLAEEALRQAHDELELRVAERTAELQAANQILQEQIAERRRAEEALRASEAEMRALLAAMTDVILVLDRQGRYVEIAPTNPDLLYKPPAELLGKTLHQLFPRAQADFFLGNIQSALETCRPVNFEYSLPIGDAEVWFSAAVSPMNGDAVVWVARDITQRKQAEHALQDHAAFEKLITGISTEFINLGPEEIDAGIQRALKAIGEFTGVDRSYVFLFSADKSRSRCTHEWCAPGIAPQIGRMEDVPLGSLPWFDGTILSMEVVHIPRVADLPAELRTEKEEFALQGIQSLIAVPLIYRGAVMGFLGLDVVRSEKTWSEQSIALLKIVGDIFVNTLENKRAREALQLAYQTLERRVQERTRELSALNAIAGVVSRSLDLQEIMSDALDKTLEVMGVDMGVAYRLEGSPDALPERLLLNVMAYRGISAELVRRVDPLPLRGSFIEKAAAAEQPMVWQVADYPNADLGQAMQREGAQVGISIALLAKGRLVGALVLAARHMRAFAPEELSLLAAIGQQVGVAIENARLYQAEQEGHAEAERRQQVAEGMREILAVLNSRQSLEAMLDFIVRQACRVLGSDGASLLRQEGTEGPLTTQSACGLEIDYVAELNVPLGGGAAGRALAERRPITIPDIVSFAASMRREPDDLPESERKLLEHLQPHYRALLSVPLIIQDEPYGAITLYYHEPRQFSEEEQRLALSVAHQAALAIETARLREQAEEAAALAERSRLARELHDSVTQSLYSVTLYAEASARVLTEGNHQTAADYLRELRDTAQEALREMRLLIFELRPLELEKVGLAAALQTRLKAVEARGGLQTELQVDGMEAGREIKQLPPAIQEELYHITQEALNNVLKHAKAQHVHVHLRLLDAGACVEVWDDGFGFEPARIQEKGGLGIAGMHERAERIGGHLLIESAPGRGTKVSIIVPLSPLSLKEVP